MATKEITAFTSPVSIRVLSYRKRKHDPDGISIKAILDGIVQRGILMDDSWNEIKKITFQSKKCEKGQEEQTIIYINQEKGKKDEG